MLNSITHSWKNNFLSTLIELSYLSFCQLEIGLCYASCSYQWPLLAAVCQLPDVEGIESLPSLSGPGWSFWTELSSLVMCCSLDSSIWTTARYTQISKEKSWAITLQLAEPNFSHRLLGTCKKCCALKNFTDKSVYAPDVAVIVQRTDLFSSRVNSSMRRRHFRCNFSVSCICAILISVIGWHPADNDQEHTTTTIPISGQPASSLRLRIVRTTDQSHVPSNVEEDDPVVHLGPGQTRSRVLSSLLLCPISLCFHLCTLDPLFCLFSHLHRHIHNSYRRRKQATVAPNATTLSELLANATVA